MASQCGNKDERWLAFSLPEPHLNEWNNFSQLLGVLGTKRRSNLLVDIPGQSRSGRKFWCILTHFRVTLLDQIAFEIFSHRLCESFASFSEKFAGRIFSRLKCTRFPVRPHVLMYFLSICDLRCCLYAKTKFWRKKRNWWINNKPAGQKTVSVQQHAPNDRIQCVSKTCK